jgi:CO dehydrogenase maturation factor
LIDAEAGIEQINRDVTGRVTRVVVVVDASQRSMDTLSMIVRMLGASQIKVVANRVSADVAIDLPEGVELLGIIPENDELKQFDRAGRPLWDLPANNEAMEAVRKIVQSHELNKKE